MQLTLLFCAVLNCAGCPTRTVLPRYVDGAGRKRVAGGPGLKETQLYTPEFGRAVAAWWMAHAPTCSGTASLFN